MTTPSKAVQKRPTLKTQCSGDPRFYEAPEADAIFESLEAELTREKERSARLQQKVWELENILAQDYDHWNLARMELGQ